ncbi:hypothetical protein B0H14DRAFT_1517384 [Mycena olivaceomarginata]|nr:hypothetical protein B0H14DRAFT_1517384 [Mycena olivaceomarginata]
MLSSVFAPLCATYPYKLHPLLLKLSLCPHRHLSAQNLLPLGSTHISSQILHVNTIGRVETFIQLRNSLSSMHVATSLPSRSIRLSHRCPNYPVASLLLTTTRYTRSLEAIDQRAMETASKLAKARGLDKKVPKRKVRTCATPFNHEFTPFLEKYFEYNAYPSVADHAAMAKKSMMEPRQIKVWFQNHRKRAKDEGLSFRRLSATDPAPLELCLRSMEEKMEPYLIPDGLRQEVDSEVSEPGSDDEEDDDDFDSAQPETVSTTNPLDPPAPRHAYPLKFKSRLIFASTILQDQEFSFPPPNWPRKAGTSPRRADITIDELITTFGSLHVHDARPVTSPPFQIPTTVRVPSAPHPALVRSTQPTDKSKNRLAPLATTSLNTAHTVHPQFGSSARRRAFRAPSPYAYTYAQPVSDPAASTSTSPSGRRRKIAGPPRRTPTKRSSRQQRGASSAGSDTDTSTSAPSRTPSLEFDAFSRTPSLDFSSRSSSSSSSSYPYSSYSRSSSTSSSSSCSSAGPATPSSSPSILPLELDFGKQPQQEHQQQQFGFARYADVAPGAVWG